MPDLIIEQEAKLKGLEDDIQRKGHISRTTSWLNQPAEKTAFPKIDRKQEDQNVLDYQETLDEEIIEQVYEVRVPTLKKWARQYHYLSESEDDMFAEFRQVFLKAVKKYKVNRRQKVIKGREVWVSTPFNTYLWYCLDHFVKNVRNSKRAKKRRPLGSDPNSLSNFTLSLDYDYNDGDGDSTLLDMISASVETSDDVLERISMDETLETLAPEDNLLRGFLVKLSAGSSVAALLREYKTKKGYVMVDQATADRLKQKRRCTKVVSDILKAKGKVDGAFKLNGYSIEGKRRLRYSVEFHKTSDADKISRALRRFKKDKESILSELQS